MKKGLILILAFTLLFSILSFIVSAQPPFTQQGVFSEGYIINFPPLSPLQQNEDFTFNFHVFNVSNGVPIDNSSTSCNLHLYSSNGTQQFASVIPHVSGAGITNEWEITVDKGNFSLIGEYAYVVQCNSSVIGGFDSVDISVTPSGFASTTSDSILYTLFTVIIFAIFLLMLYFIIILPGGNPRGMENEVTGVNNMKYLRIVLIALSYPMLILILNFLNGLAVNFTTLTIFSNILGFMFLVMLKLSWIWTLLMVIWVFYWVVKDSNFKKLMRSIGNPLPGV